MSTASTRPLYGRGAGSTPAGGSFDTPVAQWTERCPATAEDAGSIPAGRITADVAQTEEHRGATPGRPVRSGSSASRHDRQACGVTAARRAPTSLVRVRILAGLLRPHEIVAGRSGSVISWAERPLGPAVRHRAPDRTPRPRRVPVICCGPERFRLSTPIDRSRVRVPPGAHPCSGSSVAEQFRAVPPRPQQLSPLTAGRMRTGYRSPREHGRPSSLRPANAGSPHPVFDSMTAVSFAPAAGRSGTVIGRAPGRRREVGGSSRARSDRLRSSVLPSLRRHDRSLDDERRDACPTCCSTCGAATRSPAAPGRPRRRVHAAEPAGPLRRRVRPRLRRATRRRPRRRNCDPQLRARRSPTASTRSTSSSRSRPPSSARTRCSRSTRCSARSSASATASPRRRSSRAPRPPTHTEKGGATCRT